MVEQFLINFDLSKLFNVIAGVIAFFVAYLKILPLIPRSSAKILSDLEVYEKAKSTGVLNIEEIRIAIEREIYRKYRKPTRIYNYVEFTFSFIIIVLISYFIYEKAIKKNFDNLFYFLFLVDFMALAFLMDAFNEPQKKQNDNPNKEIIREPVFKFEIYSWSELFSGVFVTLIFGFWTYYRLFKNGMFEFDWWSILTLLFMLTGITILTGAFNKKKEHRKKKVKI
jgi:hypothetical protein